MLLELPQCVFNTPDAPPAGSRYLLVAGGRAPSGRWLAAAAAGRRVVAVDRGVAYCRRAGIAPEFLVGDGDSAGADWGWALAAGVSAERHPPDKDWTDLQLALCHIVRRGNGGEIVAAGVWGGRFDHAFSAAHSLLAAGRKIGCPVVLADQREALFFGGGEWAVRFARRPRVVSVLPFSSVATTSLLGCQWELDGAVLAQDRLYSVSNRLKAGARELRFAVAAGEAGLYLGWGK
jgi:thiamine pyrophosphokinase